MKGRENMRKKVGAPSTDLLVCFPSRAHLALMPKPVCSPSRPINEPTTTTINNNSNRHRSSSHSHSHLKKPTQFRGGGPPPHASPLLWVKTGSKQPTGRQPDQISEPTSPKVTCAGQIKVRPSSSSVAGCRNWQSVMEEIERIHNSGKNNKQKKRPNSSKRAGTEPFGFKKEVMQFLTCLRSIRFDFRCFGAFPAGQGITSDDEEEEEEEDESYYQDEAEEEEDEENSRAVFSKWFMVLQENDNGAEEEKKQRAKGFGGRGDLLSTEDQEEEQLAIPPANALLLMRCRSAPAQSRLLEKASAVLENEKETEGVEVEVEKTNNQSELDVVLSSKERETLEMVMKYDVDFYKLSSDIAKETWVQDASLLDPLSRSRSWKR